MDETRRDALEEVATTLEGLVMFLKALEQKEEGGEPRLELIREQLEGVANSVRGTMCFAAAQPRTEHVH